MQIFFWEKFCSAFFQYSDGFFELVNSLFHFFFYGRQLRSMRGFLS
jgi:hypothetical protein